MVWVLMGVVVCVGFVAFTGAPYVPSRRSDIRRVFTDIYPLHRDDMVVDIGSGDGVVLREVSKLGAQAVGYELHPLLVALTWLLSRRYERVSVRLANFWRTPLPDAVTVVYTFGDKRDIAKMYARVHQEAVRFGRSLTFVSYAFAVPHVAPVITDRSYYIYTVNPSPER